MNNSGKCRFNHEDIFKCANSRLGWYRRGGLDVVNFILSPTVLGNKIGDRPGLVHPLDYYLKSLWLRYKCRAVYETRTYGSAGGTTILFYPSTLFNLSCTIFFTIGYTISAITIPAAPWTTLAGISLAATIQLPFNMYLAIKYPNTIMTDPNT